MKFSINILAIGALALFSANASLAQEGQEGTMAQFDHSGDRHKDLPVGEPYKTYNRDYGSPGHLPVQKSTGKASYDSAMIEDRVRAYVKAQADYETNCGNQSRIKLFFSCNEPIVRVGSKDMPNSQYHAFKMIGKAMKGPDEIKILSSLEKKFSTDTINEIKDLLGITVPAAPAANNSGTDVAAGSGDVVP